MVSVSRSPEIRLEIAAYIAPIHQVHLAAFGRENEANLVATLRMNVPVLSFVAVEEGQVIGHIFYSPVSLDSEGENSLNLLGLAPIAVLPNYQRRGIGSRLICYSLKECADRGFDAIVVLGHPDYYPRFGFRPARDKGLYCEYPVPDEGFMVGELRENCLAGIRGLVRYRSEFNTV
jgi:putative acetyltransferase